MGNSAGSLKKHIETAEKTGALNFTDKSLEKFPPELAKVSETGTGIDKRSSKSNLIPTEWVVMHGVI
jgi:hypothetical protein